MVSAMREAAPRIDRSAACRWSYHAARRLRSRRGGRGWRARRRPRGRAPEVDLRRLLGAGGGLVRRLALRAGDLGRDGLRELADVRVVGAHRLVVVAPG